MTPSPGKDRGTMLTVLVAALAAAAYANTLAATDFIRDDLWIVVENPLLKSWSSLPRLLSVGYWEGSLGAEAPVQEFRPLLMLSYFLHYQAAGLLPWTYRLVNVLLHAFNSALLLRLLRRDGGDFRAFAAAALFAVLPVHSEAVAYVSGRSELLCAAFLLAAWKWLEEGPSRLRAGVGAFILALLTKEQAILLPAFLALRDWSVRGERFWDAGRRRLYLLLFSCAAGYWLLRMAVLSRVFHGGHDYFAGKDYLTRLLTMARFAWEHYVFPTVTGLGLQADFTRPFYPDGGPADPLGWLSLAAWLAVLAGAVWAFLRRRSGAAGWVLTAFLFILPVSNLVLKLDTIGAERFLYLPSVGFCVLLAGALRRLPTGPARAALALLLLWYGAATARRNPVWSTEKDYYAEALRANPSSAGALASMGLCLLREGRTQEARAAFLRAAELRPGYYLPRYNLGKLHWDAGETAPAEARFLEAVERNPDNADAWVFLGLCAEARGKPRAAAERYGKALSLRPWDPKARYNLGRLRLAAGDAAGALAHFREFLRLAPSDPDAPALRALTDRLGRDARTPSSPTRTRKA